MGTLLLAVGVLLVATTSVLLSSILRLRSAVGFLLAAYLVASAETVVTALSLSLVDAFTQRALLLVFLVLLGVAVALWLGRGRPSPSLVGLAGAARAAARDRAVAVLLVVALLTYAYLVIVAVTVPQSLPDTMLYHLPRAALWKQQHAVGYVANAPDSRINVFPPNAEIETSASMVLSEGDRYVGLVQVVALLAACGAVVGIARRLGLSPSASAFGALIFATSTVVVLQSPTALNDLVVAALLVICAYFAMGTSGTELAVAALALALAVGTKGTAVFALPALGLFGLASQPRERRWRVALFGAIGLAVGSFWFVLNRVESGGVTGGVVVDRGVHPLRDRLWRSVSDLLELSDQENKGLLASPLWGAAPLALMLGVALVLLWRGRRRAAGVAVLIGAIAFLVAPMFVTWARVADRAVIRGLDVLGLVNSTASRLPADFYESPMHSSYGLAFVVLFVGVSVLVVREVARRRLSAAALVALASVPLTLLVTALVLAYDPQRMRYIAFSAALAAAVFGLALRIRPLAWTAVCLTLVSTVVVLAYFVPRPAGIALLPGNRSGELAQRWFVQAGSGAGDADAFRFLAEDVPSHATLALAVAPNTYLYPAWDARLRRTIVFVPRGGGVPRGADWLVVGPGEHFDSRRLPSPALETPKGWRIYRLGGARVTPLATASLRSPACAETSRRSTTSSPRRRRTR